MVDDDNDGFASYEELKGFLLDVMYPDSSSNQRMVGRIDKLLKDKLCVTTDVRLKEEVSAMRKNTHSLPLLHSQSLSLFT
jgi:hypothetical protein